MLKALGLLAAIVGLMLVGAATGYRDGWQARDADWRRAKAQAAHAALARQQQAAQVAADVGDRHEQVRTQIEYRTRLIRERVPQYVTPAADARCIVPAGFVRVYDAAAAGTLPDPAGVADDAAAHVLLSEVADVSVENLGTCHQLRAAVLAWQDWYRQVAAVYGAKP